MQSTDSNFDIARPAQVRWDVDRVLELVLAFVLVSGLIGLIAALAGVFSAAHILIVAAALTYGYAKLAPARILSGMVKPKAGHLALIILVACVFRLTPYYYILGGQDQGLYVNIAAEIARTGEMRPRDAVLEKIDREDYAQWYIAENYENSSYLPGVFPRGDVRSGKLEFQFYHMFPVWMALVAGLVGLKWSVYALTALSILSIVFFYRLALVLTGSTRAALVAGVLLAVNPLHVFFSKFPVTEVPMLFLSSAVFAYLAMYWRAPAGERLTRWLVLAILAAACMFTTRISGFMYIPFLLAVSVISLIFDTDRQRGRAIHWWVVVAVALYAISVLYGFKDSAFYSGEIYRMAFSRVLGDGWASSIGILASLAMIVWMPFWLLSGPQTESALGKVLAKGALLLPAAFLVLYALAAYKIYQFGFTSKYDLDPWVGGVGGMWKLSNHGWTSAMSISLVVSALYLSPLVLLAFMGLTLRRWQQPPLLMLLIFLLPFTAYVAVLSWNVPYQPYYARYLLSEFVPYAMLFVVCAWASLTGPARKAIAVVLALGGVYSVLVSGLQLGKDENDGADASLSRLASQLDDADLLLIDRGNMAGVVPVELKTPWVYTYGINVATVTAASVADLDYLQYLDDRYHDIYLVSTARVPPTGFVADHSVKYRISAFRRGTLPPAKEYNRYDAEIFLSQYQRPQAKLAPGKSISFARDQSGTEWLESGWSAPETWGVWSLGNSSTLKVKVAPGLASDRGSLKIKLRSFVTAANPEQKVGISVGGAPTQWIRFEFPGGIQQNVELPLAGASYGPGPSLQVRFEMPQAVSPKAVGASMDPRVLGVGIESAELVGGQ